MRQVLAQIAAMPADQDFIYNFQRFHFKHKRTPTGETFTDSHGDQVPMVSLQEVLEVMVNGEWIETPSVVIVEECDHLVPAATMPALGSPYWYWRKPALPNEIIRKVLPGSSLSIDQPEWVLNRKTNEADLLDQYNFLSGNFYLSQSEGNLDPRNVRFGLDGLRASWWGTDLCR